MSPPTIASRLLDWIDKLSERVRIGFVSPGARAREAARYAEVAQSANGGDEGAMEDEAIVLPIEESIDLHHFRPAEAIDILDAYLDAALDAGFREVRVIHGRGKGVQRARVQRFLAGDPRVLRFQEAAPGRGGWGATLALLDDSHRSAPQAESARRESPVGSRPQASGADRGGAGDDREQR